MTSVPITYTNKISDLPLLMTTGSSKPRVLYQSVPVLRLTTPV